MPTESGEGPVAPEDMGVREDDADRPVKRALSHEIGCDLSAVSLDELGQRVELLQREIERILEEGRRKRASREAAGSFFRT